MNLPRTHTRSCGNMRERFFFPRKITLNTIYNMYQQFALNLLFITGNLIKINISLLLGIWLTPLHLNIQFCWHCTLLASQTYWSYTWTTPVCPTRSTIGPLTSCTVNREIHSAIGQRVMSPQYCLPCPNTWLMLRNYGQNICKICKPIMLLLLNPILSYVTSMELLTPSQNLVTPSYHLVTTSWLLVTPS